MSLVATLFAHHQTHLAVIRRKTQTVTNSVPGAVTYPRVKSSQSLYWRGSLALRYVSEKMRPDISGVVVFNPFDIAATDIKPADMIDIVRETITGAVNHTGGYSTGATTILVDGFTDSTTPIIVRDLFTIDGETSSTEHEVISTVRTGNVTTSITFTPALTGNVANDAVVSVLQNEARLSVMQSDDVALQGVAIIVPTKEFT
jgi:hypothetical protein